MKLFLVIATLCHTISLTAQSIFDNLEKNEEIHTLIVHKKMFDLLSEINSNNAQDEDFKEIIKDLKELKVFTAKNEKAKQQIQQEISKYLTSNSLSELMKVKNNSGKVNFYARNNSKKGYTSELLILAEKDSEIVLTVLMGNAIDLSKAKTLAEKLHLPID